MNNFELNSIINENSIQTEVLDTINPYTFIEFCSKANILNTDSNFLLLYKQYIEAWTKIKSENGTLIDSKSLIRKQIIDLLKIIVISYTTKDEQKFLSNLNWDFENIDSEEEKTIIKNSIYSILPLFVDRIKNIGEFYNNKRNEASFVIERYKLRGTKLSIEKIIFEKILNFLFNNDPAAIPYVQKYLNVSIDNFVDTYSEYFDVDRAKSATIDYNDIDTDIYFELESVIKEMLFDGNVFLNEIPLVAQLSLDLTGKCVGDKLQLKNEILADIKKCQITNEEKVKLRRKLYEKYLGVDFYYLFKDEAGNITQEKFITASNPTNNLLNQQTVDTPTTFSGQVELLKNIGLFFKPGKNSILRINAVNYTYDIDYDKVKTDTVYIFPDPKVYGNVGFNIQPDYPLVFEYSYEDYLKNIAFGWASNDPLINSEDQAIFAYYSRSQDIDRVDINNNVKKNFEDLYNKGFITSIKSDLYGNYFAIFKEQSKVIDNVLTYSGKFDRQWNIDLTDRPNITSLDKILFIDGMDFGVSMIEKGISADSPEWTKDNHSYKFLFENGVSSLNPLKRAYLPEGSKIGNGSFELYIQDAQDDTNVVYVDGLSFDTNFNELTNTEIDVQKFFDRNQEFDSSYIDEELNPKYSDSKDKTNIEIKEETGKIYVSIFGKNKSVPIEDVCPWMKNNTDNTDKFKHYYQDFIENPTNIDIIENTLIITAKNKDTNSTKVLFEQIEFDLENLQFKKKNKKINPVFFCIDDEMELELAATNINNPFKEAGNWRKLKDVDPEIFIDNDNIYNKMSPVFYVEKLHKCYIAIMETKIATKVINGFEIKFPIVTPNIYEIDLVNFGCKKYTFNRKDGENEQENESFRLPSTLYPETGTTGLLKVQKNYLTYSVDTNMFMLTYILYDVDNYPFIYKHFFRLEDSAAAYIGYIDDGSIDSTVYTPASSFITSIITPGDPEATLNFNFDTNKILS